MGPVEGRFEQFPIKRTFELKFWGISNPDLCTLNINQKSRPVYPEYNDKNQSLTIPLDTDISPSDVLKIRLQNNDGLITCHQDPFYQSLERCKKLLKHFHLETYTKAGIFDLLPEIIQNPELLARTRPTLKDTHLRALLETITRTGVHRFNHAGEDTILLWNENPFHETFPVTYHLTVNQLFHGYYNHPYHYERGTIPKFKVFNPPIHFGHNPWELRINYGNVLTVKLSSENPVKKP
jgi:hypothetical protein